MPGCHVHHNLCYPSSSTHTLSTTEKIKRRVAKLLNKTCHRQKAGRQAGRQAGTGPAELARKKKKGERFIVDYLMNGVYTVGTFVGRLYLVDFLAFPPFVFGGRAAEKRHFNNRNILQILFL